MLRPIKHVVLVSLSLWFAQVGAQASRDLSRGELLYATHCIACHTAQVHWRNRKLATDWKSLRANVRLWQGSAMLGWTEEDIDEVTRYLNAQHYRYATPG